MIPRLVPAPDQARQIYADYVSQLKTKGFAGDCSVDEGMLTPFATDNSIYQRMPSAVIFPKSVDDVSLALKLVGEERFASIVVSPRGGGTGTNGQSLTNGVVIDLSRHMNGILEINAEEGWARVQPGCVKDRLNAALEADGMFFAPELSTSNRATIGGMINTDASGQGSCLYGKTRDHVLELTTVLSDGTIWRSAPLSDDELQTIEARDDLAGSIHRTVNTLQRENAARIEAGFPNLNRCLTGYDLAHIRNAEGAFDLNALICGSEGTLGIVVEARVNVLKKPAHAVLVNISYADFDFAMRDARLLAGHNPASVETIDSRVVGLARNDIVWTGVSEFFPFDADKLQAINIVEFVGEDKAELDRKAARLLDALEAGHSEGRLGSTTTADPDAIKRVWGMRKRSVGLLGNMEGEKRPIPFVEDTAVPPEHVADFIAEFRAVLDSHGLEYGIFGHVDAGVMHVRPAMDMKQPEQEKLIRTITDEVANLTLKYGGLLWGEHGKGVRSEYVPKFFGDLYPLVKTVKTAFDPHNKLNPGKIAVAGSGELLRIDGLTTRGTGDRRIPAETRANYRDAMVCNGNGACFDRDPNAAMCPSWKATGDRRHSPKGRAALTREWLTRLSDAGAAPGKEPSRSASLPRKLINSLRARRGEPDFSHAVKEAMDGCLGCKSCAGGCPIKVNVPELKASFLEEYYRRYLRPPRDLLMSRLEELAPYLTIAPRFSNLFMSNPLSRIVTDAMGLIDLPRVDPQKLMPELKKRGVAVATSVALSRLSEAERAHSVVLVQDTFTSHFETQLVLDTAELIRALGFIPFVAPYLSNGKSLHVTGYLDRFRSVASRNARMLRALSESGVPLVGLDPAVTLTYRSEYPRALGVKEAPKVHMLQEWLTGAAVDIAAGKPTSSYSLLLHCTEKTNAPASANAWRQVFERFGLSLRLPDVGCCGMSGAYGHEKRHRETSERIYDLSWRAHTADEQPGETLLATGYSCRSQVKRFDGKRLFHPAQALLREIKGRSMTSIERPGA